MLLPDRSIKAVLFDLDDTLNDRPACWQKFLQHLTDKNHLGENDLKAAHALILKEDRGGFREKSELFGILSSSLRWSGTMDAAGLEVIWRDSFPACMMPREGLIETLTALKKKRKLKLGIVSNGQTVMQNAKIDALKIRSLVDVISISETLGVKKPDRAIFDATLVPMNVLPEQALYVGDHPEFDIVAAASIGMRTAWMSNGRKWPTGLMPRPNFTIGSLDEVLESLVVSPFPTPMARPSY
jgi:putative hydrolase of the HAD superfamily